MTINDFVDAIAKRHNFDLSQVGKGLLVHPMEGKRGHLLLVPNIEEQQHLIRCAFALNADSPASGLTVFLDRHWRVVRATDEKKREINTLEAEKQIEKVIPEYFLKSSNATVFVGFE
jgi:hypothetical protein